MSTAWRRRPKEGGDGERITVLWPAQRRRGVGFVVVGDPDGRSVALATMRPVPWVGYRLSSWTPAPLAGSAGRYGRSGA